MIEENEEQYNDTDSGFDDDETQVLKLALDEFNKEYNLEWTFTDLDFIVSIQGPLSQQWYDSFNVYVKKVLDTMEKELLS